MLYFSLSFHPKEYKERITLSLQSGPLGDDVLSVILFLELRNEKSVRSRVFSLRAILARGVLVLHFNGNYVLMPFFLKLDAYDLSTLLLRLVIDGQKAFVCRLWNSKVIGCMKIWGKNFSINENWNSKMIQLSNIWKFQTTIRSDSKNFSKKWDQPPWMMMLSNFTLDQINFHSWIDHM